MRTVTIKTTGKIIYVVGDVPMKKGDRFQATAVLPAASGCVIGSTPGGGGFISCTRGGITAPVRNYVYDPEKHEVDQ